MSGIINDHEPFLNFATIIFLVIVISGCIGFYAGYKFGYDVGFTNGLSLYCDYNEKLLNLTNHLIDFANDFGTSNTSNISSLEQLEVCR